MNNCGREIYLGYIFNHTAGRATPSSAQLTNGASTTTGLSSGDIANAGGYQLSVCPNEFIAVDLNGQVLKSNDSNY